MGIDEKYYEPPRIWPDLLETDEPELEGYPLPFLIRSGGLLLGLLFGLDKLGVLQITNMLKSHRDLKCKLVIGVYPACPCGHQELEGLFSMQDEFQKRAEFRLYVINSIKAGINNSLLFIDETGESTILAQGPLVGFNARPIDPAGISIALNPEISLFKNWIEWFDCVWIKHAIPLNSFTSRIPDLVPPEASEGVQKIWGEYLQRCLQSRELGGDGGDVLLEINEDTGAVYAQNQNGQEISLPSHDLKINQVSPLIERISRLYETGKLVSFNKLTRISPIDCPARAEWFGVEGSRQEGTITREIRYRISALDPEELKKFNNLKKNGTDLLRRLGFSLGDDLHWIPDAMIKLLQKELNRIAAEALNVIYESMGIKQKRSGQLQLNFDNSKEYNEPDAKQRTDLAKAFVAKRLKRIVADANRIYKEFRAGAKLDQKAIDAITSELESRLEKVLIGNVIPEVVQNKISFSPKIRGDQAFIFDQPFQLLQDLIMFPRMILSEDRFFLRGIKIDSRGLLEAMNVCNDQIILTSRQGHVKSRALLELSQLELIKQTDVSSEDKCRALFTIIDGKPSEVVQRILKIKIEDK